MPETAPSAVPAGLRTLTPQLWFNGNCTAALAYYEEALGAKIVGNVVHGPEGLGVLHSLMQVGDSCFMLGDSMPDGLEDGPDDRVTSTFWLYVEDCDHLYNRLLSCEAEVIQPMDDAFWGDRMGKLRDPFGHVWVVASRKREVSPEELRQGMEDWLDRMRQEA